MNITQKAREDRVRRKLRRNGYLLKKTPARSWLRREYGAGCLVIDSGNCVIVGGGGRGYRASLEDVEDWASEL